MSVRPAAAVLVAFAVFAAVSPAPTRATGPTPIVVELFTSEGCSDCPPADAMLASLAAAASRGDGPAVIALSEHVDYWDRLGWRDRFSSAAFTNRQQVYSAHFNIDSIYTPQMVVDGVAEFVGSDGAAARRAIAKATGMPHGVVRISAEPPAGDRVSVTVSASELPAVGRGDHADVVLAITEDGLKSDVKRGENRGRMLAHAAVVRRLITIGETPESGASSAQSVVTLEPEWRRDQLTIVAFVQERRGRRVLASAASPLQIRR
jgi:hypothetical protein